MNSPYSQEPAAESLAENSLAGVLCALSKSTLTVNGFLCSGRMMDCLIRSRSGPMSPPSMVDHGVVKSMLSLAVSPARTSASRERAPGSKENDPACGPKCSESFARYDHNSHSWKTSQLSLTGDWAEYSETWPQSGSMLSGECSAQPALERLTADDESGLWQTPVADDAVERAKGKWNSRGEPKLSAQVKLWPTPRATDGEKGGRATPRKSRPLSEVVFATPTVHGNYNRKGASSTSGDGLATQVGTMLNPQWVAWLMMFPIGWVSLEPWGTHKSLSALREHFNSWQHALKQELEREP